MHAVAELLLNRSSANPATAAPGAGGAVPGAAGQNGTVLCRVSVVFFLVCYLCVFIVVVLREKRHEEVERF